MGVLPVVSPSDKKGVAMWSEYERQQLTNQAECYLHTHPRQSGDPLFLYQLETSTPPSTVANGATLDASHRFVNVDPGGGFSTLYLPPVLVAKEYQITLTGVGALRILPDSPDTIVGETDALLEVQWTSLHLKADPIAGNWILI